MMEPITKKDLTLQAMYKSLKGGRENALVRAREAALYTLPKLIPLYDNGSYGYEPDSPWNSLGARGVKNLASKLTMALLPPGSNFFNYRPNTVAIARQAAEELGASPSEVQRVLGEVTNTLRRIEVSINDEVDRKQIRSYIYRLCLHLIVAGNGLLDLTPFDVGGQGEPKVHGLYRYVVERDADFSPTTVIIEEFILPDHLPDDIVEKLEGQGKYTYVPPQATSGLPEQNKSYKLYTGGVRKGDTWEIWQEIQEVEITDRVTYSNAEMPLLPVSLSRPEDTAYGDGLTWDNIGDHRSLEAFTRSYLEVAGNMSRLVWGRQPSAASSERVFKRAGNGEVIAANTPEDYFPITAGTFNEVRSVQEVMSGLERRLADVYLMFGPQVRDAERVTTAEITQIVVELEQALGGAYSTLAGDLLIPLVTVLHKQTGAPKVPEYIAEPVIVTGILALGRGHELNRFRAFAQDLVGVLGPDQAASWIRENGLINYLAVRHGIPVEQFILSKEERDQRLQQAQLQQTLQAAGPGVAQEVTKGVVAAANQGEA